jgi:hypothetical protein
MQTTFHFKEFYGSAWVCLLNGISSLQVHRCCLDRRARAESHDVIKKIRKGGKEE